jgi:membrane protein required for colicin V production
LENVTGTWNWLDWTLAGIVVVSTVAAMRKGLIRELISLASVVVGLVIAAVGYSRAAPWFEDLTKSHEVALGLGFLVLFIGTLLVGALLSLLAQKLIQAAGAEWFDRFLGGIFGLVRGVLVDAIVLLAFVAFAIKPDAVRQSSLAPYITTCTRVIALMMPSELKAQFRAGFEKFKKPVTQIKKEPEK